MALFPNQTLKYISHVMTCFTTILTTCKSGYDLFYNNSNYLYDISHVIFFQQQLQQSVSHLTTFLQQY